MLTLSPCCRCCRCRCRCRCKTHARIYALTLCLLDLPADFVPMHHRRIPRRPLWRALQCQGQLVVGRVLIRRQLLVHALLLQRVARQLHHARARRQRSADWNVLCHALLFLFLSRLREPLPPQDCDHLPAWFRTHGTTHPCTVCSLAVDTIARCLRDPCVTTPAVVPGLFLVDSARPVVLRCVHGIANDLGFPMLQLR